VPAGPRPAAPPPAETPPGAALPGGGQPLALPDLHAVARAAMAETLAGERAASAARDRLPDLIDVADRARTEAQAEGVAPERLPPPPPPGSGSVPPPPPAQVVDPAGAWRGPPPLPAPPRPARPRIDRSSWPGAQVVPRERDQAQRIGDAVYPLYQRLTDSKLGVVIAIALFGLVVPVLVLRQTWDVRLRIVASLLVTYMWVIIVASLF
jgi:hypothetical protein